MVRLVTSEDAVEQPTATASSPLALACAIIHRAQPCFIERCTELVTTTNAHTPKTRAWAESIAIGGDSAVVIVSPFSSGGEYMRRGVEVS